MYYIMEKYNSDTQGMLLRNINDWFSEEAYEVAISNLSFKTFDEAKETTSALKKIFNGRLKISELIVVKEAA